MDQDQLLIFLTDKCYRRIAFKFWRCSNESVSKGKTTKNQVMIAEIIRFSEGFEGGRILVFKMVNLYSLSSGQLSKQDHYEFGYDSSLCRKNANKPENEVFIIATKDNNVTKFLEYTIPLIIEILQDLFPKVDIIEEIDKQLVEAIINQLTQLDSI